jgi:hypothetical protein
MENCPFHNHFLHLSLISLISNTFPPQEEDEVEPVVAVLLPLVAAAVMLNLMLQETGFLQ